MSALSEAQAVRQFMKIGGQTVGHFNVQQTLLYLGLMCEEMAETMEVVRDGGVDGINTQDLTELVGVLKRVGDGFKLGRHQGDLLRCNYEKLMDGMIDTAWVSMGAAWSFGDCYGAFTEVIRANMNKFPDGVAVRDANGKIMKPACWREADLSPYVPVKPDSTER